MAKAYFESHKSGSVLILNGDCTTENWVEDAKLRDEIFPGRPIVRPSVCLGASGKKENEFRC